MERLTAGDWQEIYFAVEDIRNKVRDGRYGKTNPNGIKKRWLEQLEGILHKLGPDGLNGLKLK